MNKKCNDKISNGKNYFPYKKYYGCVTILLINRVFKRTKYGKWFLVFNNFTPKFILKGGLLILFLFSVTPKLDAREGDNLYKIEKIYILGNNRLTFFKIREMLTLRENNYFTIKQLEAEIAASNAALLDSHLLMFSEIYYTLTSENSVLIYVSLGENLLLYDILSLESGTLIRFNSVGNIPLDLGFIGDFNQQAVYFRLRNLFSSIINFSNTTGYTSRIINFDTNNLYNYQAINNRAIIEAPITAHWKLKLPLLYRYNISGAIDNPDDLSLGISTLIDFSYYKEKNMAGFDLALEVSKEILKNQYFTYFTNLNFYFKPAKIEEIILRARYCGVSGQKTMDYILCNIATPFEVRGNISNYYYGKQSVVLNLENWFHNIIVIPVKITSLNISALLYGDLGTAFNAFPISKDTWNLALGGALRIGLGSPVNISFEVGYGYEILQNSGGSFYFKMGYSFYKGSFYE